MKNPSMAQMHETMDNYQCELDGLNCRICLQQVGHKNEPYCECRGYLRWVHEHCLLQWGKRVDKEKDQQDNIFFLCQLCRTRVYIQVKTVFTIRSCSTCCDSKSISNLQLISLITAAGLFLIVMGICLSILIGGSFNETLMVVTVLSGCIALIAVLIIVWKLMVERRKTMARIKPRAEAVWGMPITNSFSN